MIHRRSVLVFGLLMTASAGTRAQDTPTDPAASAAVDEARDLYKRGVDLVKDAQWANALAAFERSAARRPHATTTFNIAACERAMGRYTRARQHFADALARGTANPGELPSSLADEATGFVREIDGLLARADITLAPATAALAVDGRPLHAAGAGSVVFVAGLDEPGRGRSVGLARFRIELDPGAHVFTVSRKGYTDAVVNRSFGPGTTTAVDLTLARLPATLEISSNIRGALVKLNGHDLGPVPVEVLRPAGTYRVVVSKDGYTSYETTVTVKAGEQANLRARMSVETVPLTKRWWFWTGAAAVLAGGAFATYALTRPTPDPPPYDGGSTGWVVRPTGVRF